MGIVYHHRQTRRLCPHQILRHLKRPSDVGRRPYHAHRQKRLRPPDSRWHSNPQLHKSAAITPPTHAVRSTTYRFHPLPHCSNPCRCRHPRRKFPRVPYTPHR